MEIKEYIKVFKKNRKLIAGIVFLVIFSTLIFSLVKPVSYEASVSYLVARSGVDSTSEYKYDDYYAIKASDLMAETVEQLLKNPEVVRAIYEDAKVAEKLDSLKDMTRKFKAAKLTSQLVEVRFKAKDYDEAKKVAESASKILKNKTSLINNKDGGESFKIIDSAPVIVENKADIVLNLAIAVISGLILGLFIALWKEYFSS